ncbi:FepA family TonB-dependent siderophore receptor [Neisseria sp. WLZKY-1]|uniref:FepA family TonB-dependent siderophore receptor n=1 Tax=Neisseria sp. WLZKY-1 TaxID=3390377 RepID=UPI00397E0BC4
MEHHSFPHSALAVLPLALAAAFAQADTAADEGGELETVYVSAQRQLQQSLGVSRITAKDLETRPAVNDISDIVRTMPGANLTGNTASGERGNKRQIDIRGMGPENTLILIDGRPVTSRNAERYSWRGERNTRGDSNWVPPEEIESISVLRGPAAARYGSGAAGGVVNIVTKKVSSEWHGSLNLFTNRPQDSKEGKTNRIGFNVSGPVVQDKIGFRLYGSLNKTDADAADINEPTVIYTSSGQRRVLTGAGRDGVRNRDLASRLAWRITPEQTLTWDTMYSRQGNIYAGDNQNNNPNDFTKSLYGEETAILKRTSSALVHEGVWNWGDTKVTAQFDRTENEHLVEGLQGGPEGQYEKDKRFTESTLKTGRFAAEANIPFKLGGEHVVTIGTEYTRDKLDDGSSMRQGFKDKGGYTFKVPGMQKPIQIETTDRFDGLHENRNGLNKQNNFAVYVEDHIKLNGGSTKLIPALRFDHNSKSGGNWSPAFNFVQRIGDGWNIKGGIARAYKAPNLYQSNPNYILYTRGQGCKIGTAGNTHCYLMGNANLKPETSLNKEIGFDFARNGYLASLAYFHNDYRNKIVAGDDTLAVSKNTVTLPNGNTADVFAHLYQWTNAKKALVEGFEGNLTLPLHSTLKWTTNFTYMRKSVNKDTGNPLSVIPKYTVNSSLNWQPTEKFDAALNVTYYGKQKPRSVVLINKEKVEGGLSNEDVSPYGLVGINASYRFNKNLNARVGINNLFNKQLYRSGNNTSAQTYNEPGRAFYGSLKMSF